MEQNQNIILIKINIGFENSCYSFKYKKVKFNYNTNYDTLLMFANPHKILKKRDITLSDKEEYIQKVNQIISEVLNTTNFKFEVNRIDYCVDYEMEQDEIKAYLYLQRYNKSKYKYMKKKTEYATSNYIKTEKGKRNFQMYWRYPATNCEVDKNTFRIEVQCKPKLLKSEYKNNRSRKKP